MPSKPKLDKAVMKAFTFWFDRDLCFDLSREDIEVKTSRGEKLLATIGPVEDTKSNRNDKGSFFVTNLRLIWSRDDYNRRNISIGYRTLQTMEVKRSTSRTNGSLEALFLTCQFRGNLYEFIFKYLVRDSLRLFATASAVWKAYNASRLYRDMRLRSSFIRDGELVLLQGERLFTRENGVSNVSKSEGHLGVMLITNLRIAWFARHAPNLNVSIPFLQLTALRLQSTVFGNAFVIGTSASAGNCVFGFRIDPVDRLEVIFKESVALWKAWSASPVLGVAVVLEDGETARGAEGRGEDAMPPLCEEPREQDGENVVQEVPADAFAAYYADVGRVGMDRPPKYDATIGLAVEELRDGTTLRDLWAVVT